MAKLPKIKNALTPADAAGAFAPIDSPHFTGTPLVNGGPLSGGVTAWAPNTAYATGQLTVYGGLLRRRIAAGTSGTTFDASSWATLPETGASSTAARFVAAGEVGILSGSPTLTAINGMTVLTLADATTSGVTTTLAPQAGYEYDVYVRWSASATFGTFYFGVGVEAQEEGVATAALTSRFVKLGNSGVNVQVRTHVDAIVGAPGRVYVVRWDRRGADANDTSTAVVNFIGFEVVPRAPVLDGVIADAGSLSSTKTATPYDGNLPVVLASIYTPIWTSANAVYVTEPVTIAGVQQSRLAKLSKVDYSVIQDVQTNAATHDTTLGHRQPSVAVTDTGTVVTHPELHHLPWIGKHSTSSEDLTTLTATTTPTGLGTNCSYRRFFRNPYNGDLWMAVRGNGYAGGVYKWDDTGKVWNPATSALLTAVGTYGLEIAFASATTMYITMEWMNSIAVSLSGYPRRELSVIKSTDGGTTWATMGGVAIALPVAQGQSGRVAMPTPANQHNGATTRIGVGADGQPILIAAWQHVNETQRGLWMAKYDATAGEFVRTRLLAANITSAGIGVGNPHLSYTQAGRIYVVVNEFDDHIPAGSPGGPAEAAPPTGGRLFLFITDDSGATWRRFTLGTGQYGGAYLDPEAIRRDNKIRLLVRDESASNRSQIWELAVPA